jgi:uncharacterized membrane protein
MSIDLNAILEKRKKIATRRRRFKEMLGLLILLAGYLLLAVSPDTPSDWVAARVVVGFFALFAGFGLAILPILTRLTSVEEL